MNIETVNARISSTMLGIEDHGIMTAFIHLDYGGAGQGFGGYAFDEWVGERGAGGERICKGPYGIEFVRFVLKTLGVESWEKLPGTYCRAKQDNGRVYAIGHVLKDQWFDPSVLLEVVTNPTGAYVNQDLKP
jgi:hypothetical protein